MSEELSTRKKHFYNRNNSKSLSLKPDVTYNDNIVEFNAQKNIALSGSTKRQERRRHFSGYI